MSSFGLEIISIFDFCPRQGNTNFLWTNILSKLKSRRSVSVSVLICLTSIKNNSMLLFLPTMTMNHWSSINCSPKMLTSIRDHRIVGTAFVGSVVYLWVILFLSPMVVPAPGAQGGPGQASPSHSRVSQPPGVSIKLWNLKKSCPEWYFKANYGFYYYYHFEIMATE